MLANMIRAYVAQAEEHYAEVQKRISERAATANQNQIPTIDKHGRMHAPCDGYYWEDEIYSGGAYLPFPMDFYEMLSELAGRPINPSKKDYSISSRVKATKEEALIIEEACGKFAEVSTGKIWSDGVSCYVYIRTSRKGLNNLIEDYIAEEAEKAKKLIEAKREAERALKGPAPEGRIQVKGKILSIKIVNVGSRFYGDPGVETKMIVQLENLSTVHGTLPMSLQDASKGDTVQFTAKFTPAEEDKTHAFFSRPAKGSIL